MKPILIFVALVAMIQCTSKVEVNSDGKPDNEVDAAFKSQYDNCLQIITVRQIDCKNVNCAPNYWDAVYAFQCLHAITGVESNIIVNSEDPYFYPTTETKDYTEYFYEDLIRWNDWYEKNKLSINMAKADSLLQVHSTKVGYQVNWPQPYTAIFSSSPPVPSKGPDGK